MRRSFRLFLSVLTVAVLGTATARADEGGVGDEQAVALPTDLHAGFLVADPGPAFYSAYGHCALRLTCPSHDLDYCFTFCMDATPKNYIDFFRGKAYAQYACVATDTYMKEYVDEGRSVTVYDLNLDAEQVRTLWQLLDEEAMSRPHIYFDMLRNHCSSMSVRGMKRCLGSDKLVFDSLPEPLCGSYRDYLHSMSAERPWVDFIWSTMLGAVGEEKGRTEDKLAPPYLVEALQHAHFVSEEGAERPVLTGQQEVLFTGQADYSRDGFPPIVLFLILSAVALLVSIGERLGKGKKVAWGFDALLLTVQTLLGLVMVYLCFFSALCVGHKALIVLVLNPLPFVLWLVARKKRWYKKVWVVYAVVLMAYVLLVFVTPQVDIPHVLMALPLLIRCGAKAIYRR